MSRLVVVAYPYLVQGFHLAGVEAYPAQDAERTREIISGWLEAGESILLALDDRLLEALDRRFIRRMQVSPDFYYLAIPGRTALEVETPRRERLSEILQQAIGFSITFIEEQTGVDEQQ